MKAAGSERAIILQSSLARPECRIKENQQSYEYCDLLSEPSQPGGALLDGRCDEAWAVGRAMCYPAQTLPLRVQEITPDLVIHLN